MTLSVETLTQHFLTANFQFPPSKMEQALIASYAHQTSLDGGLTDHDAHIAVTYLATGRDPNGEPLDDTFYADYQLPKGAGSDAFNGLGNDCLTDEGNDGCQVIIPQIVGPRVDAREEYSQRSYQPYRRKYTKFGKHANKTKQGKRRKRK